MSACANFAGWRGSIPFANATNFVFTDHGWFLSHWSFYVPLLKQSISNVRTMRILRHMIQPMDMINSLSKDCPTKGLMKQLTHFPQLLFWHFKRPKPEVIYCHNAKVTYSFPIIRLANDKIVILFSRSCSGYPDSKWRQSSSYPSWSYSLNPSY